MDGMKPDHEKKQLNQQSNNGFRGAGSSNGYAEELFAALFFSSPIGIFILQEGKFVDVNPQFERLIGFSRAELLGTESLQLVMPEQRNLVKKNAILMLKGERLRPYEYQVVQKGGGIKWIMETVTCISFQGRRATLGNFMDITERKLAEDALRESQEHYWDLFENANDIIYLHDLKGNFISINKRAEEVTGYSREEALQMSFGDVAAPPYSRKRLFSLGNQILKGATPTLELSIITRDGGTVPLELCPRLIYKDGKPYAVQGIARDITERKEMEDRLRATNQRLLDIIEFLPDPTFVIDEEAKVIAWNRAIEEMTGIKSSAIIGRGNYEYAVPFYGLPRPMLVNLIGLGNKEIVSVYDEVQSDANYLYTEVYVPCLYEGKGSYIWVKASPLFDAQGNIVGAIESIRDISDRKRFEEQLRYLSLHDSLTGLYNRTYFEEETRRLESGRFSPTGLLICDVDGLKLVNDSLGHDAGDNMLVAVARVLERCFRIEDVVARVGGDEFAIIMPRSEERVVEDACERIRAAVQEYNEAHPDVLLSVSVGFAVRSHASMTMHEIYQAADNKMYREKLHQRQSARSAIVKTLMKALQARDFITEGHAARIQDMVATLGSSIELPTHRIGDLRLLAEFHDIGKVGIPDSILFKPGPLTVEEMEEMRRHPEIGHRIALSSPDLVPIADWILKHHEWWNGQGYPLGLKEDEIPLECRILSIADAFDAMTSDRPYRRALSRRTALEELKRCAGAQFDPELVTRFIDIVEKKSF